jgi:hypothetical protein
VPTAPLIPALSAALAILAAAGCSGSPASSSPPQLLQASRDYQSGRFEAAWVAAREGERRSAGVAREESAYIAGLAAARCGRLDDAEASLEIAAASRDADLADRASRSLAVLRGGPDAGPATTPRANSTSGGFTVQAGAYAVESNARRRAEEIAPLLRSQGLGEAEVVPMIASDGRRLWAVRIGRFANRLDAGAARGRLGHPEWSIEASGR